MLLIDADARGNLTDSPGWSEPDKLQITLASIMSKVIMDEPIEPNEGFLHHDEGVDLMPADWNFHRDDLYIADLRCGAVGFDGSHVQGGVHPVVLLRDNVGNLFSPTLAVVPITSKVWKNHPGQRIT